MNATTKIPLIKSAIEQITCNATSWIGHYMFDNKDLVGGQTFIASSEMDLAAIEVFTSIVSTPGTVVLTMHQVDNQFTWGPALGSASTEFNKADTGKWKSFPIPGLHLNKGKTYGFRLEGATCYVGMGEAAGSSGKPPFTDGQEWKFTGNDQKGRSFSYFSLAFKVDVRA